MGSSSNPAGRLLNLLERGKEQSFSSLTAEQAWARLLLPESDRGNKPLLLRQLGLVLELPLEIEARVSRIQDISSSVYLEWLPTVVTLLQKTNLTVGWYKYIAALDEKTMYGLRICDELLSRQEHQNSLDQEQLEEIQEHLRTLVEEVSASDVEDRFRTWMLERLDSIDRAICEHMIMGDAPLETAIESTVGGFVIRRERLASLTKSKEGQRFWEFVHRVASLLSVVHHGLAIGSDVFGALPAE